MLSFLISGFPPNGYAVPGNHDLPHHRYSERRRSGYWTLVEAGTIGNINPDRPRHFDAFNVRAFPEGYPLEPPFEEMEKSGKLNLAVAHHYCWRDGMGHPGADEEDHVKSLGRKLTAYDAVLFGDNHVPFLTTVGDAADPTHVYNHGTFIRRRSDETEIKPQVGWLMSDGSIEVEYLDTSKDRWAEDNGVLTEMAAATGLDAEELVELMRELGDTALSFKDAVLHYLKRNKVGDAVQRLVVSWMEKIGNGNKK